MQAPKPKTKITEIKGVKYRLGKLDARSASYLAVKAAAVLAPAMATRNDKDALNKIASTLPSLPRQEFDEIQTMILRTVVKLDDVDGKLLPEPVLREDGQFVDPEMNYDVFTVMGLTVQALFFNVGDFFGEVGLPPVILEDKKNA